MKQPKRLTLNQKKCVSAYHLNPKNWALLEETDFYLKIINKANRSKRCLDKYRR